MQVGERVISAGTPAAPSPRVTGGWSRSIPRSRTAAFMADVEVDDLGDYFVGERTLVWIPVGKRTRARASRRGGQHASRRRLSSRSRPAAGAIDVAVILGETFAGDGGEPRVEILTGLRAGDRVVLP